MKIYLKTRNWSSYTTVNVTTIKPLSAKNGFQSTSLVTNFAKLKHKLPTTDGVVHARNCLTTCHFLARKVCSKNRFHVKDIACVPILDVDLQYYKLVIRWMSCLVCSNTFQVVYVFDW